ncbi:aminopeptidase P family protein [Oxalobacter sp. OttesenSCG-928-P03]|nr:aminopeptidase P family protein [Oxalobacter sp. OttesenSCG-928-P03]
MQAHPVSDDPVAGRIRLLRHAMQEEGIDACIVPTSDPHLSEYLPAHWQSRQWFSGFDGSAGTLVVTRDAAGLWTDSRYWTQAEKQLAGTGIVLMKISGGNVLSYADWLVEQLEAGKVVGLDGQLVSLAAGRQLEEKFRPAGISLNAGCDLVSRIWPERPPLPAFPVYEHDAFYVALSRAGKLQALRQILDTAGADWHFISTLDDIAWLLNLRGSDIAFNPLFISHLLVGMNQAELFVDDAKIPASLRERLAADGVILRPYESAGQGLQMLPLDAVLMLDPRRVTFGMVQALNSGIRLVEAINPTVLLKSRKAESEIEHIRRTMEQDGAALCEFFAWFESALEKGERVTELTVAEKLEACRKERPGYVSLSFDTIAGFNENGALPHYRATAESHAVIGQPGLLLIDSGAQYFGGTTDITRVVPVGVPSAEQKRDFTLVLKGLIALSCAHFPRSVRASMLDAIARAPLWQEGVDYGHGTGHGIGYFLNVHEGPQSISYQAVPDAHTAMEEGMVTSIEPGIYRPGRWGIRLENLVVNRNARTTEFGEYLGFETLTLCPLDTRCMDMSLLTHAEVAWLNRYHAEVRHRLLPLLSETAKAWLVSRTHLLSHPALP